MHCRTRRVCQYVLASLVPPAPLTITKTRQEPRTTPESVVEGPFCCSWVVCHRVCSPVWRWSMTVPLPRSPRSLWWVVAPRPVCYYPWRSSRWWAITERCLLALSPLGGLYRALPNGAPLPWWAVALELVCPAFAPPPACRPAEAPVVCRSRGARAYARCLLGVCHASVSPRCLSSFGPFPRRWLSGEGTRVLRRIPVGNELAWGSEGVRRGPARFH